MVELEAGEGGAQLRLGLQFYEAGEEARAAAYYKLSADQGNPHAQGLLGELYDDGEAGLTQDEPKAVQLYALSAEGGDANGQMRYGYCFLEGRDGVAVDLNEARRWFKLAAAQGNEEAAYQSRAVASQILGTRSIDPIIDRVLELFDAIDGDSDGRISGAEFRKAMTGKRKKQLRELLGASGRSWRQVMGIIDADHDASICLPEFNAAFERAQVDFADCSDAESDSEDGIRDLGSGSRCPDGYVPTESWEHRPPWMYALRKYVRRDDDVSLLGLIRQCHIHLDCQPYFNEYSNNEPTDLTLCRLDSYSHAVSVQDFINGKPGCDDQVLECLVGLTASTKCQAAIETLKGKMNKR